MNGFAPNDPVSSWGPHTEKSINASGVTFAVKFMGYVPVPKSIKERHIQVKDAFVGLCINTVVSSTSCEQFRELLSQGDLGPFVSVNELDVFLNIANFTLTFFHIQDGRTHLLGRYMNDQISHYKAREIDGRQYLGMVMKNRRNEKRECNVIMLDNRRVIEELINKMKFVDDIDHTPTSKLECRLRSTQEYGYRPQMLSCFHGRISHEEACRRLTRPGDFLIRESSINGEFAASYQTSPNTYDRALIPSDNINFFRQFQVQENVLKRAVVRPHF